MVAWDTVLPPISTITEYLPPSVSLVTEDLGMQVTNEDTNDWWVHIYKLPDVSRNYPLHCNKIIEHHHTLSSDLYWIDCTVPLEKFLELKHYQVYISEDYLM